MMCEHVSAMLVQSVNTKCHNASKLRHDEFVSYVPEVFFSMDLFASANDCPVRHPHVGLPGHLLLTPAPLPVGGWARWARWPWRQPAPPPGRLGAITLIGHRQGQLQQRHRESALGCDCVRKFFVFFFSPRGLLRLHVTLDPELHYEAGGERNEPGCQSCRRSEALTQRQPAGRRVSCEMQNLRQRKLAGQWRHGPNAEHRTACGALGCHRQNAPPASCPTLRSRPSPTRLHKMLGVVVPAPPDLCGQNAQAMWTPSSKLGVTGELPTLCRQQCDPIPLGRSRNGAAIASDRGHEGRVAA